MHNPLIDEDPAGPALIELPRGLRIFIAAWPALALEGFAGLDVLRVEFSAELPWLLEEEMPAQ